MSIERLFVDGNRGVVVTTRATAPPSEVWRLLAQPGRWPDWSPHIRSVGSALPDGAPPVELEEGQRLTVRSVWPIGVRAEITRVEPGYRWDFVAHPAGPWSLENAHVIEPDAGGCSIGVAMRVLGPGAALLDQTALRAYGLLAQVAVDRLARLAEREAAARRPRAS